MSNETIRVIIPKGQTISGVYSKLKPSLTEISAMPFIPIKTISRVSGVCTATIENMTIAQTGLTNGTKTYISQCFSDPTFNIAGNTPIEITNVTQVSADVTFQYTQAEYVGKPEFDATVNNTTAENVGLCAFGGVVRGSGGTQFVNGEATAPMELAIDTHTVSGNIGTITITGDYASFLLLGQKIYTSGDAVAGFNGSFELNVNSAYNSGTGKTTLTYDSAVASITGSSGTRKLKMTAETKDFLGISIAKIMDASFGEYRPNYDFTNPDTGRNGLGIERVHNKIGSKLGTITFFPDGQTVPIDSQFLVGIDRVQDVNLIISLTFAEC